MAIQAAAVDLLMNEGELEPPVALAIAKAMAVTMTEMQVVSVPVLDSRVAVLDHKSDLVESRLEKKIDVVESKLEKKIDLVESRLEKKIDLVEARLEKKIDLVKLDLEVVRTALEGKIEVAKTQVENKIDVAFARLEKLNEATKAELVRWVFVATIGSVFLQSIAAAIANTLMHH